jgi:hypothetical protein
MGVLLVGNDYYSACLKMNSPGKFTTPENIKRDHIESEETNWNSPKTFEIPLVTASLSSPSVILFDYFCSSRLTGRHILIAEATPIWRHDSRVHAKRVQSVAHRMCARASQQHRNSNSLRRHRRHHA